MKTLCGSSILLTVAGAEFISISNVQDRELMEIRRSYYDLLRKLSIAYQKIEDLKSNINDQTEHSSCNLVSYIGEH